MHQNNGVSCLHNMDEMRIVLISTVWRNRPLYSATPVLRMGVIPTTPHKRHVKPPRSLLVVRIAAYVRTCWPWLRHRQELLTLARLPCLATDLETRLSCKWSAARPTGP